MTPDDVIGEFMRSATSVEGGADMHYLDVSSMAAEIVRLRATVERVRGLPTWDHDPTGDTRMYATMGKMQEACLTLTDPYAGDWAKTADILAALEGTDEAR